jgi:hypothetical protein
VSLLRPILRSTAVAALRDRTWAADRVYDSDLTPLATAVYGGPPQPYIVVYTDLDDLNPVDNIAKIYASDNRILSIAIEIGIATAVRSTTTNNLIIQFAATDSGMELACDCVAAQALSALIGDPQSQWGELFKRMVTKVRRIPSRRGGMSQQGVRFAARRVVLQVQPLWDFVPGQRPPDKHPVWDFINLARANPQDNVADVAGIVEGLINITSSPDWRIAQAQLGLTEWGVRILNVPTTPLPDPWIEEPPLDWSDTNEFVPVLGEITVSDTEPDGMSTTVSSADFPTVSVGSPEIDAPTLGVVSTGGRITVAASPVHSSAPHRPQLPPSRW